MQGGEISVEAKRKKRKGALIDCVVSVALLQGKNKSSGALAAPIRNNPSPDGNPA